MNMPKMYVLVREEFRAAYCAGQAIHAVVKYGKEHPDLYAEWNNSTVVILGIKYPQAINIWKNILHNNGIAFSVWEEADQMYQTTAIACYHTGELFKKLKLFK